MTLVATKGNSNGRTWKYNFRYEAGWFEEKACKTIIKKVWQIKGVVSGTWSGVRCKLENSRKELKKWSKGNVRPNKALIMEKTRQLSALQDAREVTNVDLQLSLKKEIVEL